MSRLARVIACLIACVVVTHAQQTPAPQTPLLFKSAINVVHLDVSVLDRDRQPVHGLTAADFTVVEDGKPQPITTFSAVEIPNVDPPPAVWMREVSPDVHANSLGDGRLIVIVMDDATVPNDLATIAKAKTIARTAVDKLGPTDLAAVIFTSDNRHTQDFTNDRARLQKAIDSFSGGMASYTFGHDIIPEGTGGAAPVTIDTDTPLRQASIETLRSVSDYLIAVPQRRKALLYISVGVPVDPSQVAGPILATGADSGISNKEAQQQLFDEMKTLFRQAQKANLNIYSVDPSYGLLESFITRTLQSHGMSIDAATAQAHQAATANLDFLNSTAENTGGHAAVTSNAFESAIDQLYRENGSYYLMAFESGNTRTDGGYRRLEVKVNRPGVTVRTRSGYYAPQPEKPPKDGAVASPVAKAMAGLLPNPDVPMRVMLAPFAVPGQAAGNNTVALAIVLAMEQPAPAERVTENIDLQANAFTPDGQARGAEAQHARLVLRAASPGAGDAAGSTVSYEVLARIDLKPGRYNLRLAAHNVELDKSGSVYTDVEIPDFTKDLLSLSGVVLDAAPGPAAAPRDALAMLVPIVPTTERSFDSASQVTAFLRVYQGGKAAPAPVTITTRILNDHDASEFARTETLAPDQFKIDRAAAYRLVVPMSRLTAGAHLLRIDVASGRETARRDVAFVVK